jgi:hypothetical protein
MSTHPNAILLLRLKPDDLARKTLRAILDGIGVKQDDDGGGYAKIGERDYSIRLMESSYDEDNQISADEGDIIVYDLVTYGYGECIEWSKLSAQRASLAEWATGICERHKCTASFYITANYW